jgi:peroxiredoxin
MNYAVVIGNQELGKSYELGSMPMTLLIDRKGKIAATHVGVVSKSDCENEIESLLKQK